MFRRAPALVLVHLVLSTSISSSGCAFGMGVTPRGEGGVDAGVDGGVPMCDPPCDPGQLCRGGSCVADPTDMDADGVPGSADCDDTDPEVGATAERDCSTACAAGVERCADGLWGPCTAPLTCECADGSPPRELECGLCGAQRQICAGGTWTNDGECSGEGLCRPGEVDTETRACACGADETRTRACDAMCGFGAWSAWSGCTPCTGSCGDGSCGAGETCSTCADCQNGHLGMARGGESCAGVPPETWRCIQSSTLGWVSQFCRGGVWTNFNTAPRDCMACVCTFSAACCQSGSTSSGC